MLERQGLRKQHVLSSGARDRHWHRQGRHADEGDLVTEPGSPFKSCLPLEKARSITRWSGFLSAGVLSQADKPIVKKSARHPTIWFVGIGHYPGVEGNYQCSRSKEVAE
jgi:hypothetical protein